MDPEREPLLQPVTQRLGRHPQHPPGYGAAAGGEVDPGLVPRAEAARPLARRVHPADHRLLATDGPDQVQGAVDEHPPAVGVLALVEEVGARHDRHLLAVGHELADLVVVQPVEQRQRPQVLDAHHTVAR